MNAPKYLHINRLVVDCVVLEIYPDGSALLYSQGRIAIGQLMAGSTDDYILVSSRDIQNEINGLLTQLT